MQMIYKILTPPAWAQLRADGTLVPTGVDAADGYVHFSTVAQLGETLDKHYAGHGDLVLLALPSAALGDNLMWERARNGDLFPHLYAPLRADMVRAHFCLNGARVGLKQWLAHQEAEAAA